MQEKKDWTKKEREWAKKEKWYETERKKLLEAQKKVDKATGLAHENKIALTKNKINKKSTENAVAVGVL